MNYFKKTMHQGALPSTFANAAHLRRNPTKAEEILWSKLRNNQIDGVHFRRQHPFSRYVPDFYAHAVKLVIELDGYIHEEKSVKFSDVDREMNLKLHGLYILRFPNEDVYYHLDEVVSQIREAVIDIKNFKKK